MSEWFSGDYHGQPFILFSPPHLAALAIIFLINLGLFLWGKRMSEKARRNFRYGLATLLLVDEALWHLWNYTTGQWTIQSMLPLHICSVFVYLSACMLVTRNYSIYEFAYFLGLAAATQALLTPDAGRYGFPHFRAFQVMVSHGSIVTAAVYMTVVEGFRPYPRSLYRLILWMNIYMVFVGLVNWWLGSNYLFIAHKPETASLIDVLGPWPWYILSLEAIGISLSLLLYLPFALQDRRARDHPMHLPDSIS